MREKIDFETRSHADNHKKKDFELEISKLSKNVDALTLEQRNLRPVHEQTAKRRKDIDITVKNSEAEKETLERNFQEMELAGTRLKSDNKNMTADVNRIAFNLEAEKKIFKDISEKVSKSSEELVQTKEKLIDAEENNRNSTALKLKLEKRLSELQPQLKEALIKIEKLNKEISGLTEENANFLQLNEEINLQIAKLEKKTSQNWKIRPKN